MGYPHPGYRIAPVTLREILEVPLPGSLVSASSGSTLRLCDLDETSWLRFGRHTCLKLAEAVVTRVAICVHSLPPNVRERRLPTPPQGIGIEDLELKVRTYNCLRRMLARGQIKTLIDLGNLTVGEILKVPSLGAKSLVDLLTSVESVAPQLRPEDGTWKEKTSTACQQHGEPARRLYHRLSTETKRIKRSRWARIVRCDDMRLGAYVRGVYQLARPAISGLNCHPNATVFDIASCLVRRDQDPPDPMLLASRLRHLRKQVLSLSHETLEQELAEILASCSAHKQSRQIMARRVGWDGGGGCTLQVAGDEFGITRERVRQICDRLKQALRPKGPFAPVLHRALRFVATAAPGIADKIETDLSTRGLSKVAFRLEGLLDAAQTLGHKATFMISTVGSSRIVVRRGDSQNAKAIVRISRQTVRRWGIATVQDVAGQAAGPENKELDINLATGLLSTEEGFNWLDREKGWFWLRAVAQNSLLNRVRKILSVAPQIDVGELRSALARHYRMEGFAPPRNVLLELCRQLSGLRVQGTRIEAIHPPDWERTLVGAEKCMARILKADGPIMQREKFEQLCTESGMKRTTFYVYIQNSPIIARYAPGVYGLVGAEVAPGLVESLRPKRRTSRVIMDYGWADDSKLWLAYRLSKAVIASGICHIPSSIRRFVDGDYALRAEDGSRFGNLRCRGSFLSGLGHFFARRGGEPDDYLLIKLDLKTREAALLIGDESLIEMFSETSSPPI